MKQEIPQDVRSRVIDILQDAYGFSDMLDGLINPIIEAAQIPIAPVRSSSAAQ
jgi:hypothetical protein